MISSVRRRKTPLLASIVAFHRVPMVLLIQNRRQKRLCDLLYQLIWLFRTDPRCLRGSRAVFSSPAKTYHRLRVLTRSFSETSTTASRTFSWRVSTGSHTVSNRESRRTVFRRIAHHADREWPAYRSTPLTIERHVPGGNRTFRSSRWSGSTTTRTPQLSNLPVRYRWRRSDSSSTTATQDRLTTI